MSAPKQLFTFPQTYLKHVKQYHYKRCIMFKDLCFFLYMFSAFLKSLRGWHYFHACLICLHGVPSIEAVIKKKTKIRPFARD